MTAQLTAERALREQARRDPLTRLLNHGAILEELQTTLERCAPERPCAVALADVDGLKEMNDTYGHLTGDNALRAVARALARGEASVGRYGGDEFLVVIDGANAAAGHAYARAFGVRDQDATIRVGVTIGLALHPRDGRTARELIRRADDEMYRERGSRGAREGRGAT